MQQRKLSGMDFTPMSRSKSPLTAYSLSEITAANELGLSCWVAEPTEPCSKTETGAPLVAVHGIARDAREQAKLLAQRICQTGRAVIAPFFDAENWPAYQRVVDGCRADSALIELLSRPGFDRFFAEPETTDRAFHLFGFSGGAQFAHRFAFLNPSKVLTLTIASAGWYTFPDEAPFPYGLGSTQDAKSKPTKFASIPDCGAEIRTNFGQMAKIPTCVVVGGRDCVVDRNTRSGRRINAQQGRTRVARAHTWTRAMRESISAEGLNTDIRFEVLQGCGHDFAQCVRVGELDAIIADQIHATSNEGRRPCDETPVTQPPSMQP